MFAVSSVGYHRMLTVTSMQRIAIARAIKAVYRP